jgi:hypothetical protein
MGDMTPIDGGALYRDIGGTNTHGDLVRVERLWINTDGDTMIQVYTENTDDNERRMVQAEPFITSIGIARIRVNTDHEAWEWRDENR